MIRHIGAVLIGAIIIRVAFFTAIEAADQSQ